TTWTGVTRPCPAHPYRSAAARASAVCCSDTAPFTDLLLGREFMVAPPALDRPLPPDVAAELARMRAAVVALAAGTDLLIYDTQFTHDEYRLRPHWGHSHPDDALTTARAARSRRPAGSHPAPLRTADDNAPTLARYRGVPAPAGDRFEVLSAYEGLELPLGDGP